MRLGYRHCRDAFACRQQWPAERLITLIEVIGATITGYLTDRALGDYTRVYR